MTENTPALLTLWRHRKGGVYRVLHLALRESDLSSFVAYQDAHDPGAPIWLRPTAEFLDGRFSPLVPIADPQQAFSWDQHGGEA